MMLNPPTRVPEVSLYLNKDEMWMLGREKNGLCTIILEKKEYNLLWEVFSIDIVDSVFLLLPERLKFWVDSPSTVTGVHIPDVLWSDISLEAVHDKPTHSIVHSSKLL